MATLTIRDLDDELKQALRLRAAGLNRSMEEEARQILRAALTGSAASNRNLAERIRSRFAAFGDVQLPQAPREPMREPPAFDARPASPARRRGRGSAGRT
jgi:antitoxin FitA